MDIKTFPAPASGICDYCKNPYEVDDFVAQPTDDEVICPDCVMDLRLVLAA